MNVLTRFMKHLSGKSKLFLLVFFLMAVGLLVTFASPFILIWYSWDLAWRVGATGLLSTILLFLAWWFIYNTYWTTIDTIRNE